jgi:hypothetical protein
LIKSGKFCKSYRREMIYFKPLIASIIQFIHFSFRG